MACENNPCSSMLPAVGMASPIVGDEYDGQISNLNLAAAHFSGGRRRKSARKYKGGALATYPNETDINYALLGGRRRKSAKKGGMSGLGQWIENVDNEILAANAAAQKGGRRSRKNRKQKKQKRGGTYNGGKRGKTRRHHRRS